MANLITFSRLLLVGATVLTLSGCQMYRAPGNLLPSLATVRQDRSITEYAQTSSFPSPSDVGLAPKESTD